MTDLPFNEEAQLGHITPLGPNACPSPCDCYENPPYEEWVASMHLADDAEKARVLPMLREELRYLRQIPTPRSAGSHSGDRDDAA
jgi:hypothetical protein